MLTTILVVAVVILVVGSWGYKAEKATDVIGSGCDHENTQYSILRNGKTVVTYTRSQRQTVGGEYVQ